MYAEKLLVRRQNVGALLAVVESLDHRRNEGGGVIQNTRGM